MASIAEYGSGKYWVRLYRGEDAQTNRYADLSEAVECYRKWRRERAPNDIITAHKAVAAFKGRTTETV